MTDDKRLFLLDAYALIFRAYYSFIKSPRINSRGQNTSATFGFTTTLWDLMQREKPTHIAVVFDPPGDSNIRLEMFDQYKANRDETPEDIKRAVPYIKRVIEAFRIPTIEVRGYEADDVIGTLAKKAARKGYTVYMMTPDKDYGQLVEERILMYKPARSGGEIEIIGPAEIKTKYGFDNPEQVIDFLGMMGDAVDNIPGIPGVGEKTALKFIHEYGSLEGLYENTDKLKGAIQQKVIDGRELAFLSKKLATIITDVPVELDEEALVLEAPDKDKLIELFTELEFRTLAKRLTGEEISVQKEPGPQLGLFDETEETALVSKSGSLKTIADLTHTYYTVTDEQGLGQLVAMLAACQSFCFDTETTGVDALTAELVGLSFCFQPGTAYYVPVPADRDTATAICALFKPALESSDIEKVGQNLKYDMEVLLKYQIRVGGPLFDTMIAHYLLQPDQRHGMDEMAEYYLSYKPISIETLIGEKGKKQGSMRDVAIERISEYAAEDADITLQLKLILEKELTAAQLNQLFRELECPLIPVLAAMEEEGVKLDSAALLEMSKALDEDAIALQDSIRALAGVPFNLDSPKQLGEVLFEHLKIDSDAKKTKTGQYQTNEETLLKLANNHEIIGKILDYRSVRKLKSTYVDSLPTMVNAATGRVHTTYMQTVAATGRLSSNNPNLQNIPIRTARGREIRKAFVPRGPGFVILAADYSQVELRIIAAISGDEGMQEAFKQGLDIHAATAAKVFDVPLTEVSREMRSKAKAVNFGIAYGQGAFGLAQNLNISRNEAKQIIDSYFEQFPGLMRYKEQAIENARQKGYAETVMGRRRQLPDINSANHVVRSAAERNAINAPIQGSAADIIKVAMINLHRVFQRERFASRMILQVHDELVFDALETELETIVPIVRHEMENAYQMAVPLVVDINKGNNWLEAH